jgi:hypothetical protein
MQRQHRQRSADHEKAGQHGRHDRQRGEGNCLRRRRDEEHHHQA